MKSEVLISFISYFILQPLSLGTYRENEQNNLDLFKTLH